MKKNKKFNFISQNIINANGLNSARWIGPCTKLITECQPKTFEQWEKYYYNFLKKTGKSEKLKQEIRKLSIMYRIPQYEIKEVFRVRAIVNTWEGWYRELQAKESIERIFNCKLEHSTYEQDSKLGVDFFMYKNNKLICGVQVKPMSYILGKSYGIMRDKSINKMKYEKFKEIYNVEIIEVAIEEGKLKFGHNELRKVCD